MSTMLTLIRYRPTLFNSASTLVLMRSRKASLSWLICSIVSVATVSLSCPKMISFAISSTWSRLSSSNLSAAELMIRGSVETPMVNVLGTFILMFCCESAFLMSMFIVMGVSEM